MIYALVTVTKSIINGQDLNPEIMKIWRFRIKINILRTSTVLRKHVKNKPVNFNWVGHYSSCPQTQYQYVPVLVPYCEVFFFIYEVLGIKIGLKGFVEFISEGIFGCNLSFRAFRLLLES